MNPIADDILMHYGVKRRSGRYPWGSGKNPFQHSADFLARVEELQKQGLKEKEIVEKLGMASTGVLRLQIQRAKHERREVMVKKAKSMREDGKTLMEIADALGFKNDSSVRTLLNDKTRANKNQANEVAEILKKKLDNAEALDVGVGVENNLGVSRAKLDEAIDIVMQDYEAKIIPFGIPNATNIGKRTNTKVLAREGVEERDLYQNPTMLKSVDDYHSTDGGKTFQKLQYPASIDGKRVAVRFRDEGGLEKDGTIEIRRGVKDLDLGNSHYAQVRILVDGDKYIKGMAMYSDDVPEGYDMIVNSNKNNREDAFKKIKTEDPNNPFGAQIKANGQSYYKDPNGKFKDPETGEKVSLSPINKLKEEGDWESMEKGLSSQFLSKQPMSTINKQIKLTELDYKAQFEELKQYSNPTVKQKLLEDFAGKCDTAAWKMKMMAFPRQSTKVILPMTHIKENEIYAPAYKNGEKLSLVRFPHGSITEIPTLTVNNKNPNGKRNFGNMQDAVAVHPKVAERLSGADFDGDFVTCIPNSDKVQIQSAKTYKELIGYEPKDIYATDENFKGKLMQKSAVQNQMGSISNLITDMTLRGAPGKEIAKALKHSMTVIDAEKHKLDYKQSEIDNDIAELKRTWQRRYDPDSGKYSEGASTLLSKRKREVQIPERRGSGVKNKETGEYEYKETGRKYYDKKGNLVPATQGQNIVLNAKDVRSLSSGTAQENAYADYANYMKSLANQARKEAWNTPNLKKSSEAAKKYAKEVASLEHKLNVAKMNAPRERQAQAIAYARWQAIIKNNPGMLKKDQKKVRSLAIADARIEAGARSKDTKVKLDPKEWEAINAGAISHTKLQQILKFCDEKNLKEYTFPKDNVKMSTAQVSKIKHMSNAGYTLAEIAESLDISPSTVSNYLK